MSTKRVFSLLAAAALAVAACSSSGASSSSNGGALATTPAATPAPASSAAGVVVEASSTPNFGTVLTGPNGMTLYTHAGDTATSSTCTGSCATSWPPLVTTSQPMAGTGVTGQLGTLTRADGTVQVTYAGLPLYYWVGDSKAGDVTGNGVEGFTVATVGGKAAAPQPSAAAPAGGGTSGYGY